MKQYRITDWGTIYDVESTEEEDLELDDNLVKHSDHLAAVSQARADALRWVLEQMKPFPNRFGEWPTVAAEIREKGINEYLATLRTIIEKELNQ